MYQPGRKCVNVGVKTVTFRDGAVTVSDKITTAWGGSGDII